MKNIYKNIALNKITLSFPQELENEFQKYVFKDSINVFRFAFLIVTFLYGLFGILDSYLIHAEVYYFYTIRFVIVIPVLLIVFGLSFTKYFAKIWQWLLFLSFMMGGTGILAMVAIVPGEYSYYLGLMLVIFAGYFFVKLRFIIATIAGWLLVVIFNIVMFNFSNASSNLIISYNFFFISANIIGMFAAYYIELFYRRNYWLAENLNQKAELLNNQNNKLDELVKIRTSELEESQNKLNVLFESMSDMVVMHELIFNDRNEAVNYIITDCNKAFTDITGFNKEDIINKNANLVYSTKDTPYLNEFRDVAINGTSLRFETYNDYLKKFFLISVVQIGVNRFATITIDITESRIAENELIKAKERAEESDNLKTAFLQNISHEIRTPLNGIIGFTNLLNSENISKEEIKDFAFFITNSGKRLIETIDNIIDISKIEARQVEIFNKLFSINSLIFDLQSYHKQLAIDNGLVLNYSLPINSDLYIINSDESKLFQIFTNLINNAIKFTNSGSIDFGYEIKDNFYLFFVKDTGIGISEKYQAQIFTPFTQADLSNSRGYEGAGIGLCISKGLVEILGGKIWVESEESKGSTFYFTIPKQ